MTKTSAPTISKHLRNPIAGSGVFPGWGPRI